MYLRVHVAPDHKRESIIKEEAAAWRVSVREPAQGNRANDRVRTLVAREFAVPLSAVRILTGHQGPSKLITIDL